ncbi:sensor histidine kinase [Actinoplanes sp. NPDC049599]|uniref:sensor histidine kinase n=1 Tax=Actinoplanes sp. NPDC049599 TaxID=3363903 RepID=UPI0037B5FF88
MIRTLAGRLRPLDLALAAAFTVFALVEEYVVRMPGAWWPYALTLFAALVLLRRLVPVLAIAASSVSAASVFYDDSPISYRLWQLVAMIIAAYTAGQLCPAPGADRRARLRGLAAGLFVLLTALVYWENDRTDPMAAFFFTLAPYALGVAVALQNRRLAETAAVRASIREQQAREAVTEERVRIARELHDMVAHSVTVMVIQAGVVRRRLDAGLDVDPQLLHSIEASGREAVGELRRTLGLLRGDAAETAPPSGLDRLDELAGQVREAGLAVTVRRHGEAVTLPPAVDLSAYRIAQEALTNVLKHAAAASATVTVDYRPDGLHLTVEDDGTAPPAAPGGGGQGLIGMRERVTLFGGELTAGPRPEGGFSVAARLPVPAQVAR